MRKCVNSQKILRLDPQNHHESMNHHFDEKNIFQTSSHLLDYVAAMVEKSSIFQVHCAMPLCYAMLCCWFLGFFVPFWESFLIPPQPTPPKHICEIFSKHLLFEGFWSLQICDKKHHSLPHRILIDLKRHTLMGLLCLFIYLIILKHYIFSYTMANIR